jgi:hypothetical protein
MLVKYYILIFEKLYIFITDEYSGQQDVHEFVDPRTSCVFPVDKAFLDGGVIGLDRVVRVNAVRPLAARIHEHSLLLVPLLLEIFEKRSDPQTHVVTALRTSTISLTFAGKASKRSWAPNPMQMLASINFRDGDFEGEGNHQKLLFAATKSDRHRRNGAYNFQLEVRAVNVKSSDFDIVKNRYGGKEKMIKVLKGQEVRNKSPPSSARVIVPALVVVYYGAHYESVTPSNWGRVLVLERVTITPEATRKSARVKKPRVDHGKVAREALKIYLSKPKSDCLLIRLRVFKSFSISDYLLILKSLRVKEFFKM